MRNDPAFPVIFDHSEATSEQQGLTKREWFAGQALVGCFNFWVQVHASGASIGDPNKDAITQLAYEYADAMVEAGAEPEPPEFREMYPSEKYLVEASEQARAAMYALRQNAAVFDALPAELREQVSKAVIAFEEAEIPF
jgi:hypothetical protein